MVEQDKSRGLFVLEIHGIKSLQANRNGTDSSSSMRKMRPLFAIKSTVQVSIFPKSSDLPCKSPPPQQAAVKCIADSDHKKNVLIETDRLTIKPETLSISGDPKTLKLDEAYKMMLSINFIYQSEAEDLYRFMGVENAAKNAHTRLATLFKDILECPDGTTILPLKDRRQQLKFGIEVSMYWTSTRGRSILSTHNEQIRIGAQPNFYPTPPASTETARHELTFVYANKKIHRSDLGCPYEAEGCHRRPHKSIDALRMHMDGLHNNFRHRAVQERVDENGVEHWRFECEVSENRTGQRASDRADEPFDVRVMPPPRPFDRRQYLSEGNDDYQREARLERSTRHPGSKTAVNLPTNTRTARKLPECVQERPAREKKTYSVPRAPPGVTYFRSRSKRPLKEGESISESDDEVDTEWIALRKRAEDRKNNLLSDTARRFLNVFDRFMQDESIHADIHAGDAIVRFARGNGAWLWQEQVFQEFQTKLDELLEDDIISKEVHAASLEFVEGQKPAEREAYEISQRFAGLDVQHTQTRLIPASNSVANRTRKSQNDKKAKAKAIGNGHLTQITTDSDGDVQMRGASLHNHPDPETTLQGGDADAEPPYDLCLCGTDALISRASAVIVCDGIDCIRRYFHPECIEKYAKSPVRELNPKQHRWTCDDCQDISETAS
ncbi:uncharacterized protein K460DRAFT_376497 [Cucurbitaria berberidis CBS 394.84]|uniref:Polycomb protein VEFS-Box domain-containing protein n=1 Tax=Cucurbitaria berberidis CBS 394.84 TaxID=1168544 RepID=A0A9P4GGI9_9PLEO|nr:uncharacterized protein K460DRAFT_376497 [Cucurbitaria berberidis CBS 394.84]KAF1844947.1 hypothetical protein K460DRAFT_376497 [Cucurbitaria berberidis CBS 394.84]